MIEKENENAAEADEFLYAEVLEDTATSYSKGSSSCGFNPSGT
ncbi:hypothetical protein [Streptantibioticus cattleyicolor]|uniref:Uncharacterized protein n=1 Tax=Streptantibioticus cattleyicolor (strain ATCC 35852 / DSM 46488 / JCM 4925 / NBRC 14057 / NRRL 8057) TaxID=1003195 RepID=F8JJL9_STREN|nr:hypothetical protein [Streptantibioticus cattleyicolor]AEW99935.1 hypothetical protein SCATT_p17420 [Streptantibioticus cattleyicolor NRRL 8057 = DSM 46488]CCB71033.1 protein of unknown function [Streptantibioticus cattleyicolor NRRL 8057 = DSM 46488]